LFCPNCGAENKETTVACDRCGFKLSGVSASKFKGTIMLNTEESVQKLVEAEKLKRTLAQSADPQQAGNDAQPPANADLPPATPTPAGVPRPRRKMGGTLLGVAPQFGGIKTNAPGTPQAPAAAPTPAPGAVEPPVAPPAGASATDPSAPTQAMQAFAPVQNLSATVIGGTQVSPVFGDPNAGRPSTELSGTPPPVQAAPAQAAPVFPQPGGSRTVPLAQVPTNAEEAPQPAPARLGTVPLQQATPVDVAAAGGQAPQARPGTVPLQTVPEPAASTVRQPLSQPVEDPLRATVPPPSAAKASGGLSAGELFLVIATCGLYGVVRMLRRKKS
jgi:hypothetical protein